MLNQLQEWITDGYGRSIRYANGRKGWSVSLRDEDAAVVTGYGDDLLEAESQAADRLDIVTEPGETIAAADTLRPAERTV